MLFRRTSLRQAIKQVRRPRQHRITSFGERLETRPMLSIQPIALSPPGTNSPFSEYQDVSADGRFVVFGSLAKNLVPGDSNNFSDVFLRDMQTGAITLISTGSAGPGNSNSYSPSISADGRYVAFVSTASNFAAVGSTVPVAVYARDILAGTTTLVSTGSGGIASEIAADPRISGNGRYVVFASRANNLTPGDTNGAFDVFVRDLQLGTTTLVSTGLAGQSNDNSTSPSISDDGRYIAFQSDANNLAPGDSNDGSDVFVRDMLVGTTTLVGTSSGAQGNGMSFAPNISADGRYVAFSSYATNLTPNDANGASDIFLRNMQTGEVTLVSSGNNGQGNAGSFSPSVSADARFVTFLSDSSNLAPADTNGTDDIFVRDLQSGRTTLIRTSDGQQANSYSYFPQISEDGYHISFSSSASNFSADDTNNISDVFLWTDEGPDTTPPTVIATSLDGVTVLSSNTTSLEVSFSESIFGIDAADSFRLVGFGADLQFGTSDDVTVAITVTSLGSSGAKLSFATLPESVYRLSVTDKIFDAVGNQLDGNADGQPLGTYTQDVAVVAPIWLDQSFGSAGKVTNTTTGKDRANAMVLQPDGKIVVAGSSQSANRDFLLVRYNPDGSVDTTFGTFGKVVTPIGNGDDQAFAIQRQSDGKFIVVGTSSNGTSTNFALVRYNADGSLDTTFGANGKVTTAVFDQAGLDAVTVQPDGKIVAVGYSWKDGKKLAAAIRYLASGTPDASFGAGGVVTTSMGGSYDEARSVVLQTDGKIVVGGDNNDSESSDFALLRINSDGTLDQSFGLHGKVITSVNLQNDRAYEVELQSDGKIVAAGFSHDNPHSTFALVRYNVDGSLDTSFGKFGIVETPIRAGSDIAFSFSLLPGGGIMAAGSSTYANKSDFALARYHADGSLDASFGNAGVLSTPITGGNDFALAMAVQPDGKAVLAGYSIEGAVERVVLARFLAEPIETRVVAQYAFYNNSQFDGGSAGTPAADDAAVATNKSALRPGGSASFANYTSYSRGINGVMIDIAETSPALLTVADVELRIGNDDTPDDWQLAPPPASISVRPGEGAGGSDRFTLTWPDGAIKNTWLKVTVLATAATRLAQPYVFYYGNAVADSGNSPTSAVVNATDEIAARNHPQTFLDPAAIDNPYDYNRDGLVNATDQILSRENSSILATSLRLISLSTGSVALASGSPAAPLADERDDRIAIGLAVPVAISSDSHARTLVETATQSVLATSADVVIERDSALEVGQTPTVHAIDTTAVDLCLDEQLLEQIAAEWVMAEL